MTREFTVKERLAIADDWIKAVECRDRRKKTMTYLRRKHKRQHNYKYEDIQENKKMSELIKYKCHKTVEAMKIVKLERVDFEDEPNKDSVLRLFGADNEDNVMTVDVSMDYYRKHLPKIDGYYVVYEDGYESHSPKIAFEDGYERIVA